MADPLQIDMTEHRRAVIARFVADRDPADIAAKRSLSDAEQIWLDGMLRFERVAFAPNVSPGLDRPPWYLAWQVDTAADQNIQALWIHTGEPPTQWERIWGGGGDRAVQLPGFVATDLATEQVLAQETYDFTDIAGAGKTVKLEVIARALDGATGTIKIHVGGTPWLADGTLAVSATATSADMSICIGSSAAGGFTCPTGSQLVKLSLQSSSAGKDVQSQGARVRFV